MNEWKCSDLKCVRKPTRSRLSLTPCKQIQPLSRVKLLDGPRVRGISPVGKEKVYERKDLLIVWFLIDQRRVAAHRSTSVTLVQFFHCSPPLDCSATLIHCELCPSQTSPRRCHQSMSVRCAPAASTRCRQTSPSLSTTASTAKVRTWL